MTTQTPLPASLSSLVSWFCPPATGGHPADSARRCRVRGRCSPARLHRQGATRKPRGVVEVRLATYPVAGYRCGNPAAAPGTIITYCNLSRGTRNLLLELMISPQGEARPLNSNGPAGSTVIAATVKIEHYSLPAWDVGALGWRRPAWLIVSPRSGPNSKPMMSPG
jgi:hypothetical protein